MDQNHQAQQPLKKKSTWIGLLAAPAFVILYFVLGFFDNSTELYPSHNNVLSVLFFIAGLCALLGGIAGAVITKKSNIWRRLLATFAFTLLGFIVAFLLTSRVADIVEGQIDFPPSKTRTYTTLIRISRAYQTHGKGRGWHIQTTPIWSDLEITQHDYNFMLDHRRPGDQSNNPAEISSAGYFCAKVTVQQSPDALRILHAGAENLPKGTVMICPSSNSTSSTK